MAGMDMYGDEEKKEVNEVLDTSCFFRFNHEHLRNGKWKAKELEEETKKITNAKFAHAVSSGSNAVTTLLSANGIGFGDEVVVPPFTYLATIESVLYNGALPIFADIDKNLCLNGETIEKVLTPKTKAVLVVHMCGASADMDSILEVCKRKNLILLEDAGQAFGAFYKGKSVGLFGGGGAFSLDFFKIVTAGEGGLCITNDEKIYKIMDQFSDHGHDHIGSNRSMENHPIFGTNFRMSELHAAIGLVQVKRLNLTKKNQLKNKKILKDALKEFNEITFREMPDPTGDSGTFLNFFMPNKELAQQAMKQFVTDGISGFNYWYLNMYHFINQWDHIKELKSPFKLAIHHLVPPQDYNNLNLPVAQNVIGRLISLGIKANWTEIELENFKNKLVISLKKVLYA